MSGLTITSILRTIRPTLRKRDNAHGLARAKATGNERYER